MVHPAAFLQLLDPCHCQLHAFSIFMGYSIQFMYTVSARAPKSVKVGQLLCKLVSSAGLLICAFVLQHHADSYSVRQLDLGKASLSCWCKWRGFTMPSLPEGRGQRTIAGVAKH